MTITIKLRTDNAAFSEDRDAEVLRILREWLDSADQSGTPMNVDRLQDFNGNTVGSVTVTGK